MSNPKSVVCLQDGTALPIMEEAEFFALNNNLIPVTTQTGATVFLNRDHIVFVGATLEDDDVMVTPKLELL